MAILGIADLAIFTFDLFAWVAHAYTTPIGAFEGRYAIRMRQASHTDAFGLIAEWGGFIAAIGVLSAAFDARGFGAGFFWHIGLTFSYNLIG